MIVNTTMSDASHSVCSAARRKLRTGGATSCAPAIPVPSDSASATASPDANRSCGSRARQRSIVAASAVGTSGRIEATAGAARVNRATRTASSVVPSNGERAVSA